MFVQQGFHVPSFGDEDFQVPSVGGHHQGSLLAAPVQQSHPAAIQVTTSTHFVSGPQAALSPLHHGPYVSPPGGYHHLPQSLPTGPTHSPPNFPPPRNTVNIPPQYSHFAQEGPCFPPQTFDIPDIEVSNSVFANFEPSADCWTHPTMTSHSQRPLGSGKASAGAGHQVSPNTASPGRESVEDSSSSDDSVPLAQVNSFFHTAFQLCKLLREKVICATGFQNSHFHVLVIFMPSPKSCSVRSSVYPSVQNLFLQYTVFGTKNHVRTKLPVMINNGR